MSATESAAWWKALKGTPEMDGGTIVDPALWEDPGCENEAVQVAFARKYYADQEQWAGLRADVNAVGEQYENDPEMRELAAQWASCMTQAGYPGYSNRKALGTYFDDLYNGLCQNDGTIPGEQELWKQEIATAQAEYQCREQLDYDVRWEEIRQRIDAEFVAEHRAELDAYVLAFFEAFPEPGESP